MTNNKLDVILHLCPKVPLMTAVSFVIARRLQNSATLQVLALVFQEEKELMAQVDVLRIAATRSVIAVIIIIYLLWQNIKKDTLNLKA